MTKQKVSHRLYHKYEFLAHIYANKLFNYEKIGLEKSDIIQELKMKIFTSILAYGKRWGEYMRTKQYRPVPLLYYVKHALNNKLQDMAIKLNREFQSNGRISIQDNTFDVGKSYDFTKIDFANQEIIANGVDLLDGLGRDEKGCFCLYLKGFSMEKVHKVYKNKFDSSAIIRAQLEKLRKNEELLLSDSRVYHESHFNNEDY